MELWQRVIADAATPAEHLSALRGAAIMAAREGDLVTATLYSDRVKRFAVAYGVPHVLVEALRGTAAADEVAHVRAHARQVAPHLPAAAVTAAFARTAMFLAMRDGAQRRMSTRRGTKRRRRIVVMEDDQQ